ncbi:MAG: hypothetical protein AUI47_03795 [Acidobacteria bacterium 13_1_40CM_2_68_5]|nr:MAG: hypothetical protein AUI47_03795 [Acidobacteria bacterium 13_1_40CM_2_68_5]
MWQTISVVDETRGKALIEEVADFMTPTDNDRSVAADQIQNRYERARKKEARKEKADVATIAAPGSPPENTEGMLKVPANTPITLEILENVCSGLTNTGETVWFRVAADAAVDGSVVLKKDTLVKGTVREAEAAMGGGKEGVLDIVVPALTTRDGSALPTIGQIASAGMERGDASLASGMGFGLIGALAVKGREAYHLAGEKFTVRTRQEAWVHADGPAGETDQTPQAPTASDEGLVLKGRATDPIKFKPRKGKVSDTVEIDLDADAEPREVIVHAFGATEIPEPIKAVDISRHGKGWRCTFNGWEFARHLREDGERTAIPVEMRGALQDGRTFVAEAAVTFTLERE